MTEKSTEHPRLTAIVVVFNSAPDRLQRCLAALRESKGVRVEIVLVDNASQSPCEHPLADRTLRMARNGGFAAGVNAGLKECRHDWVAVVNDDATVQPDTLRACIDAIVQGGDKVMAASPKILFAGLSEPFIDSCGVVIRPTGEAFSAGAGQPDIGQFDREQSVLGPCLSTAVFRRDAFKRIGKLDERYFLYYEDIDWSLRSFLAGYTTAFVPTAIALHEHAASTRSLGEGRRYRLTQRNLLLCATANLSFRSVARIWMGRLVAHAKALVKGPDRWSGLASLAGAAVRTPGALLVRRHRRSNVIRSDQDAFAYADGLVPFVDTTTYLPTQSAEARASALVRRDSNRLPQ